MNGLGRAPPDCGRCPGGGRRRVGARGSSNLSKDSGGYGGDGGSIRHCCSSCGVGKGPGKRERAAADADGARGGPNHGYI
jgi:hypothetical protein